MRSRKIAAYWLLAGVLLASLLVDLSPRFHLGDSATYLHTRVPGFLPLNRSWTYGMVVSWLEPATGWLNSAALVQIFLSWGAYAFFAIALTGALGLRRGAALAVIAVGALEPSGFYWARAFMSDSPAQSAFVFLCGALLLRCSLRLRFGLVFAAGFVLISLRTLYFPAAFVALLAAAAWTASCARRDLKRGPAQGSDISDVRGWVVAAVAFLCANLAYATVNTLATRCHTFTSNMGDMEYLAAAASPLGADQLSSTPLTSTERAALLPLIYENRNGQLFSQNGLVPLIRGHYGSGYRATEAARPAMRRFVLAAIVRHPIGLIGLVLRQWRDYLNPTLVLSYHASGWWSGAVAHWQDNALPRDVLQVFGEWRVKPKPTADLPARRSFALSYFEIAGGVWSLTLALYATLAPLAVARVPGAYRSGFLLFSAVFSLLYMASLALSADELVTRYLLPLAPPMVYTGAVLLLASRRRAAVATGTAPAAALGRV